ncbi:MAG TPA: hypothetical protein PL105_07145 [Caldilineaceae bacterium]|nr:hypothetical protein [Caldilineaceae bacterium]
MDQPTIRLLTTDDAAAYRRVRLQALQEHPEAFGSSAEDFAVQPLSDVADRLRSQGGSGSARDWPNRGSAG